MAYFIVKQGEEYDYKYRELVIDEEADLSLINVAECCPGSTAYVVATGNLYMLDTKKEWRLQ